ncbi:hypothetical protein AB0M28_31935 [Streptomyces sp. NPDC051940]|uniref:hypothetical protein n=1 Tax=Streptomyces sp. NPDC051940 TaxID=3155675 RepID=UPI0034209DD3
MATSTGEADRDLLVRFLEECFGCAQACQECAVVCWTAASALSPEARNRLDVRCAEICERTARLLSRQNSGDGAALRIQLEVCAETCRVTADNTFRPGRMEHRSAQQAASCRRCEVSCRRVLGLLTSEVTA